MPTIPTSINEVSIEFAPTVNKEVDQILIDALNHCIKSDIDSEFCLDKIYISSAADSHEYPSRHMQNKAVDISRINDIKMAVGYSQGGEVKAIVDAIQNAFETFPQKRENFGPLLKNKLGTEYSVSGHNDHIHLSVN